MEKINNSSAPKQWLADQVGDMGKNLHLLSCRLKSNIVGVNEKTGQWKKHDENHPALLIPKLTGTVAGLLGGVVVGSPAGIMGSLVGAAVGVGIGGRVATDASHICLNAFRAGAAPRIDNISKGMLNWAEDHGAKPVKFEL